MRCPHCAAEVPEAAAFCGTCGRRVSAPRKTGALHLPEPLPAGESASLFALPVSQSARWARIAAVLVLDAVLAGSGVAMIFSYRASLRAVTPGGQPEAPATPEATPTVQVDVELPKPKATRRKEGKKPDGTRAPTLPPPGTPPPVGGGAPDVAAPDTGTIPDLAAAIARLPDASVASVPTSGIDAAIASAEPPALPPVVDEGPDPDAEFSAEGVRTVVQRHMILVKRCYARAAKSGTGSEPVEGKVDIQFTILPSGSATDVRVVGNTTGSESLGTCVAALLASWSFPSPGVEPIDFVWPFVFKASR